MFGMLYLHKILWNFETSKLKRKGWWLFAAQLAFSPSPSSLMKYLSLLLLPLTMSS